MAEKETHLNREGSVENRETGFHGTRIIFYGFPHDELNLEGVPHIVNALKDGLERRPTKAVLFLEDHYISTMNARQHEKLMDVLGGLTNLRVAQLIVEHEHKMPDREEIDDKKRALFSKDFDELVVEGVLPTKYVLPLYLAREIDSLREVIPFDIVFESHAPELSRMLFALQKSSDDLQESSLRHFNDGNFDNLLRDWKSHIQLENIIRTTRHRSNLADLKERAVGLGENGFIFVLMGASHLNLADDFKSGVNEKEKINIEAVSNLPYTNHTYFRLHKALQDRDGSDDLLYAQDFIEGIIGSIVLSRIQQNYNNREALKRFAYSFEVIYSTVQKLAASLSLEEIKEMFDDQSKIFEVLQKSPLAEPITEFTSSRPKEPASRRTYAISTHPDITNVEQAGIFEAVSPEGSTSLEENPRVKSNALIKQQFSQREEAIRSSIFQPFIDNGVLTEREALLIYLRFIEKQRVNSIASSLGLTDMAVYQNTSRTLKKLPPEVIRDLRGGAPIVK